MTYVCVIAPGAPNWWPAKLPGAVLDYSLDIGAAIDPETDFIASVSLAVAPSGSGEMQPSNLTVSGLVITATMSGGQPTRVYSVRIIVTMTDGQAFEFLVEQGVRALLSTDVPQIAPVPGFGAPIVWTYLPSMDFTNLRNSAYLACIAGF